MRGITGKNGEILENAGMLLIFGMGGRGGGGLLPPMVYTMDPNQGLHNYLQRSLLHFFALKNCQNCKRSFILSSKLFPELMQFYKKPLLASRNEDSTRGPDLRLIGSGGLQK